MSLQNLNQNQVKTTVSGKPIPPPQVASVETTAPKRRGRKPGSKSAPREKVRLVSVSNPRFQVRTFMDTIKEHGVPLDPQGVAMVPGEPIDAYGYTAQERAERREAKKAATAASVAEKRKLFNEMPIEERQALFAAKKVARAEKRAAKQEAIRAALVEQIRADIAAGKI